MDAQPLPRVCRRPRRRDDYRQPAALASALMKISGRMDKVPQDDLREQSEMNAFFIIPIKSDFIGRVFSTHPSTENRIDRLPDLERELEVGNAVDD